MTTGSSRVSIVIKVVMEHHHGPIICVAALAMLYGTPEKGLQYSNAAVWDSLKTVTLNFDRHALRIAV